MLRRWTILIAGAALLATALSGCRDDQADTPPKATPDPGRVQAEPERPLPPPPPEGASVAAKLHWRASRLIVLTSRGAQSTVAALAGQIGPGLDAVDRAGRNPALWTAAGQSRLLAGDSSGARICFLKALSLDSEHVGALRGLAEALTAAGLHEQALAMYSRLLSRDPSDSWSRFNRAVAAIRTFRYDQAEDDLKTLIAADPGSIEPRFNLAVLQKQRGQYAKARVTLQEVIDRRPDFAPAQEAMMQVLLTQGLPREALPYAAAAAQCRPADIGAWQAFAECAIQAGSLGRALIALQKAVELADSDGQEPSHLGLLLLAGDQPGFCGADSVACHAAAAIHGQFAFAARLRRAQLYRSLGDVHMVVYRSSREAEHREQARRAWQTSLKLDPRQEGLAVMLDSLEPRPQ